MSVHMVCLSGLLDAAAATSLADKLMDAVAAAGGAKRGLVLDLSDLQLVSAAGTRAVALLARLLGGPVHAVIPQSHVRRLLEAPPPPGLTVFPTLAAALAGMDTAALPGSPAVHRRPDGLVPSERRDLRTEVFGLRARSRSAALIGVAQGILVERYGLAAPADAFKLLKASSQHCNVPLRVLASAVVTEPEPTGTGTWDADRAPAAQPELELLDGPALDLANHSALLRAVASEALTLSGADAVEIHLADQARSNSLFLEGQSGLDATYRDCVAQVSGPPALCGLVRLRNGPVLLPDIAEDPTFARTSQGKLARLAGTRAMLAVPVRDEGGVCVGVITVHRRRSVAWPVRTQRDALETLASDLGRWRAWYGRTVVVRALEHLRTHASGAAGPAARPGA
ncbi:GAF domain-containing protein [Streptomyces indicus]|nr:GAF domain-containing protein [Streptomyces indicus]